MQHRVEDDGVHDEGGDMGLVQRGVDAELAQPVVVDAQADGLALLRAGTPRPANVRVDAALFYTLRRGIETQINIENLFGAHYFPSSNGDNNIAPSAPRTIKATVGYRF